MTRIQFVISIYSFKAPQGGLSPPAVERAPLARLQDPKHRLGPKRAGKRDDRRPKQLTQAGGLYLNAALYNAMMGGQARRKGRPPRNQEA